MNENLLALRKSSIAGNVPSLCVSGGLKKTDFPINN
jgi:hypothetical protein